MRKSGGFILLSMTLTMLPATPSAASHDAREIANAKAAIEDTLKDPASVIYRDVRYYESSRNVCGEYNAKNGYGGYVGFKLFRVDASGNVADVEPLSDLTSSYRKTVVDIFYSTCANP